MFDPRLITADADNDGGGIHSGKIVIVASSYNPDVMDPLIGGSVDTLLDAGVAKDDIALVRVPGSWELCSAASMAAADPIVVGIVALGCVIKGETTHDEHINRAVSLGLMELSLSQNLPIGFGLLTCNTHDQALARAGGDVGNKGSETAEAVLQMLRLKDRLSGSPEEAEPAQ